MSIDDVMERATIPFPEVLEGDEVERMFAYMVEQVNCEIKYRSTKSMKVGNAYSYEETQDSLREEGREINGSIVRSDTGAFEHFELMREFPDDEEDKFSSNYFSGLKFSPIPGYEINEHRDEIVQLWDNTRELVNAYFTSRRT